MSGITYLRYAHKTTIQAPLTPTYSCQRTPIKLVLRHIGCAITTRVPVRQIGSLNLLYLTHVDPTWPTVFCLKSSHLQNHNSLCTTAVSAVSPRQEYSLSHSKFSFTYKPSSKTSRNESRNITFCVSKSIEMRRKKPIIFHITNHTIHNSLISNH